MPFTVAVDAWNLVDDRRGMGRYVRRVLHDWENERDLDVTLVVRNEDHRALLADEFPFAITQEKGLRADAVWYPWNALRFRVPRAGSVVTLHDAFAFTLPHRNLVARWREQAPIRRAVRTANALAVNSSWSAHELARIFAIDASRFTIVHPVPDAFWRPAIATVDGPYMLVVGGPDERKNLQTLFSAFERAFAGERVRLVIAGTLRDEDERALECMTFARERIRPDDETLRRLYSNSLAVPVPSSQEGYGLMAVEAMACGAPVVAAGAAALPEACDGAALLVPPFDVDQWVSALRAVAQNSVLRESLRARSLERAERIDRLQPARLTLSLLRRAVTERALA